jgi:hypothetical protein
MAVAFERDAGVFRDDVLPLSTVHDAWHVDAERRAACRVARFHERQKRVGVARSTWLVTHGMLLVAGGMLVRCMLSRPRDLVRRAEEVLREDAVHKVPAADR